LTTHVTQICASRQNEKALLTTLSIHFYNKTLYVVCMLREEKEPFVPLAKNGASSNLTMSLMLAAE